MQIIIPLAVIAVILAIVLPLTLGKDSNLEDDEAAGRAYMERLDTADALRKNRGAIASWAYASNVTDENNENSIRISLEIAKEEKEAWEETITYNWQDFQDYDLKRKFQKYSELGAAALPEDRQEQLQKAVSAMQSNYAVAKICDFVNISKCDLALEPEITEIFANSQNTEELKHAWVEWHKEAGAKVKNNFIEYVTISNEVARANNYTDYAEYWLSEYEDDDFEAEMGRIWEELKPLYLQIHAYVRRRLWDKYGDSVLSKTGPIPAHLLGNVWAQQWNNVESITRPYPDKPDIDITGALVEQNYTALKIFQTADEFFQSLNLTGMPQKFWDNSILAKPDDGRELICHASAWDFYDGDDFRVKQCTVLTGNHFRTAHHEMGHIEYYLQYKHHPVIYRRGANPGFHEAVGDVISLSVGSMKHLRKIGLVPEGADDAQTEINKLFSTGIEKIVFLPFAYMLDLYRYGIFRGETKPENYNCHFWNLREELQGLEPPTTRTEEQFDAAAKYHVSADVEYLRYYVSFVIQFQFHRSLCEKAGEYVPNDESKKLTNCDIYQSIEAGNALGQMLQLGSSRPWQDAMEMLTGQRNMTADGILEYFSPLHDWLKQENERTSELIGWEASKIQYCTDSQRAALNEANKTKKTVKEEKPDSLNK